jgi:5-methylcytosine-specific restriction enzyme A
VFDGFEGAERKQFVIHRRRERGLRNLQLEQARQSNDGRLICEVPNCGFDFQRRYGDLGIGYAEVHHNIPLKDAPKEGRKVKLSDLSVVCANCHAMIHVGGECRPIRSLIPK